MLEELKSHLLLYILVQTKKTWVFFTPFTEIFFLSLGATAKMYLEKDTFQI